MFWWSATLPNDVCRKTEMGVKPILPSRRVLIGGAAAGAAAMLVGRPLVHFTRTWSRDREGTSTRLAEREVDDASHLNRTRIAGVVSLPAEPDIAAALVRDTFVRAKKEGRNVSIAGARHTMGGHTLAENALVIETDRLAHISVDENHEFVTVGSGTRWRDLITALDPQGRSVSIMQSNDDFSVGGSISANCHGWQPNRPPIASSVERFRLLTARGDFVSCSRTENAALFALTLGGYGLFGVIIDATLRITKNVMYTATRAVARADDYAMMFAKNVRTDTGIAYGRLSIAREAFLTEAMLTAYDPDPTFQGALPPRTSRGTSLVKRLVFRGEVESDYGKSLRWSLEQRFGGEGGGRATRNDLLSEPVSLFANRRRDSTDILHEYFVPPAHLGRFLARARVVIPAHGGDLLNVTVRNVMEDQDTFLRYARQDVLALVMLFSQARTDEADARMKSLTQALIDAVIAVGGAYYLPYRGHATREQFRAAYPMTKEFFAQKNGFDPDGLLTNNFFTQYV